MCITLQFYGESFDSPAFNSSTSGFAEREPFGASKLVSI